MFNNKQCNAIIRRSAVHTVMFRNVTACMYGGLIRSSEREYVTCMYTTRGHNRYDQLEQRMATVYACMHVHKNAFGPKNNYRPQIYASLNVS